MGSERLALEFTLAFVERHLPRGARVLEVGAGDGALARALLDRGHRVVALDLDAAAVAAARARGVDAREASFPDFPDFDGAPFDVVLFTRSLHHVHPLGPAMERAAALLVPGGSLVIEDWAWNRVDDATARWMYAFADDWKQRGLAPADEFRHEHAGGGAGDPLRAWIDEHERECHLHADHEMLAAALACFAPAATERPPYFFRYPCRWLRDRPDGVDAARRALEAERDLIARGAIQPIGWRWVGVRRTR